MALKKWKDVLYLDVPDQGPVTEKSIECALIQTRRHRGSVRVSLGRIWTDKDFERRRTSVLATPLP